jgi:plastocyanin
MMVYLPIVIALAVLGVSCGGSSATADDPGAGISAPQAPSQAAADSAGQARQVSERPARVDPRRGGFEITMGEWAVATEAKVIRPGAVTLVIANRGAVVHGFELKSESHDGTDLEWRLLQPGETMRVRVDLGEGVYELECYVGSHDDLGMRTTLQVRKGAPLARKAVAAASGTPEIDITGFAYRPAVMTVKSGQTVTWVNHDAAPHTVTQQGGGGFASRTLNLNSRFGMTFRKPGTYHYFCAVHPGMKGTVIVKP